MPFSLPLFQLQMTSQSPAHPAFYNLLQKLLKLHPQNIANPQRPLSLQAAVVKLLAS